MPGALLTWVPAESAAEEILGRLRVLVAVKPRSLVRLIEHLFHDDPELFIVGRPAEGTGLARRARRLAPDVVVASTRLLGRKHGPVLADLRRFSPASKLILICPAEAFGSVARASAADAHLAEEAIVRRLVPTLRQLGARVQERR